MSNPKDRELRTQFSMAALDLAEMMKLSLGMQRFGNVKYRAELEPPSSPSTGGGKTAAQPIKLVPEAQGFATLAVGHVNAATHSVELRIYEYIDLTHRQRFGKQAPIDRASYGTFLDAARLFFSNAGMQVRLAGPPAELAKGPDAKDADASSSSKTLIWVLVALLVVAIGVIVAMAVLKK
jgi:hypothetical protein